MVKGIGRKAQIWEMTMANIGILEFIVPQETLFDPTHMEWLMGIPEKEGARVVSIPSAYDWEIIDLRGLALKWVSGTGSRPALT